MGTAKPKSRMSRQRQVILNELRSMKSHPTADEIYEAVRRQMPRISLGTVYRNLETLSESGIIQKLELGGSQKHFDGYTEDHYHIRCIKCGRLDDIQSELIPDIEGKFGEASDYQIMGHQLLLIGLCPKCKKIEFQNTRGKEKKQWG